MPWLSGTDMKELEKAQREAARKITGAVKSTPIDAVITEDELPTVASRAVTLATIAVARSRRASVSNPRYQMAMEVQRRRLKKTDWRGRAVERWKEVFEGLSTDWRFPPGNEALAQSSWSDD
jgi:hypothetical protein